MLCTFVFWPNSSRYCEKTQIAFWFYHQALILHLFAKIQHFQACVGKSIQRVFFFSVFGLHAWNSLIPKISFWGNPNNVLKLIPKRKWTGVDLCCFLLLVSCYFSNFLKSGICPFLFLLSESKLISWRWEAGVRGTGIWAK